MRRYILGVSVFVFVHRADLVWLCYLLFFLTVFFSPFHHRFELSTLTHTQTLAHSLTYQHTTYGSDHKSSSDVHAHRLLFDIFSFHCLFCFYYSFSLFVQFALLQLFVKKYLRVCLFLHCCCCWRRCCLSFADICHQVFIHIHQIQKQRFCAI